MRSFLLILTLTSAVQIFAQRELTKHPVQNLLNSEIAGSNCVGISAAYSVNGETVWEGSAGYSERSSKSSFNLDSQCRIASISKPMTAVAIMQLMEAGKIDLDKSVSSYLPDFPKKEITVRQVLNHSSGIRAYQNKKENNNYINYEQIEDALEIFINDDLLFEPGSNFNYTSYGYNILGLLIEKISGQSFASFLNQNIWEKVEMTNTEVENSSMLMAKDYKIYHRNNKGKIKTYKTTNLSDRIPAGGIISTAPDLIKFGNGILDGTLIKKETMLLMQENLGLKKEGNGYGLGWYLYGENPKLGNVFGHNGAQLGSSCWLMLLPDQKAVVTVLSNTSGVLQETFNVNMEIFGLL